MNSTPVHIVFTDLDGTLLDTERTVSAGNLQSLVRLGERGIVRVIATGRSLYSFSRVIAPPFPVDYLIFSSGAGILDLRSSQLLFSANLEQADIDFITARLQAQRTDYMVHCQVPDNHRFVYHDAGGGNEDFHRRIRLYREFASAYEHTAGFPSPAAQVIAVLPRDPARFTRLQSCLENYHVIRTTSPLDHHSIWMEIQPHEVHKGSAAARLCRHLGIDPAQSVGIGNDYNDIDLLDFTRQSFLLGNAPSDLQRYQRLTRSNDEDGFSRAVEAALAAC